MAVMRRKEREKDRRGRQRGDTQGTESFPRVLFNNAIDLVHTSILNSYSNTQVCVCVCECVCVCVCV